MITTVGKEVGQYFEVEEFLNFPCEELLTIDGLWVQYSQGKFGFSVQKEIYLSKEVGGIADGRYHGEAFSKFCNQVGWEGKIKYTLDAPKGHLPCNKVGVLFLGIVGLFNLFSRIETCKL
jgi:hypothetical protein